MKTTKIKRLFAVILVLLLLVAAIILIFVSVIPNLVSQITSLAENIPTFAKNMESWISRIADDPFFKQIDIAQQLENLNLSYGSLLQQFLSGLSTSLGSIVSTIASATMIIVTVPFILFYMLKDGEKLVPNLKTVFPERRREQIVGLLGDLNKTLSNYISGQAIECILSLPSRLLGTG